MGLAETARLAVELNLGGNFAAGLTTAEGSLGRFNATAATAGTKSSVLSNAFAGIRKEVGTFGGAMSHAGNQLKGFGMGLLGLAGVGGLLGLGAILGSSVRKVEDFGAQLEKVQKLTGETALASGALILQFTKFLSIDKAAQVIGFTEKTLGKLNETTAKSVKVGKSAELQNLELVKAQRQAAGQSTKNIDALIREQKGRDAVAAATAAQIAPMTKLEALDAQFGLHLVDGKGKVVNFSAVLSQLATFYDSNASASTKAYVASQVFGRGYVSMIPILNEGSAGLRKAAQDAAALGLTSTDTVRQLAEFHDGMHALDQQVNVLQLSIGTALLPSLIDLAKAGTDFISGHRGDIVTFFRNAADAGRTAVGIIGQVASTLGNAWNSIPGPLREFLVKGLIADRTIKFLFGFSPVAALVSGLEGALSKSVASGIVGAGLGKLFVQPVFVTNPGFGGGGIPGLGGAAGVGEGAAAAGGMGLAATIGMIAAVAVPIVAGIVIAQNIDPEHKVAATGNLSKFGNAGMSNFVARPTATRDQGYLVDSQVDLTKAARDLGYQVDNASKQSWASANEIKSAFHFKLGEKADASALLAGIAKRSLEKFGHIATQGQIANTFTRDLLHTTKVIQGSNKSTESKIEALKVLARTADGHSSAASAAIKSAIATDTAALRAKKLSMTVNNQIAVNTTVSVRDINRASYAKSLYSGKKIWNTG